MGRLVLAARSDKPVPGAAEALDGQVAMAISIARRLCPPMKVFANDVRVEMGLSSLSRRSVYAWERGEARVPAAALLAAAKVAGRTVDELLSTARKFERLGLRPGE